MKAELFLYQSFIPRVAKCTMPLMNINSDWMSNASSGLCINLFIYIVYAGPLFHILGCNQLHTLMAFSLHRLTALHIAAERGYIEIVSKPHREHQVTPAQPLPQFYRTDYTPGIPHVITRVDTPLLREAHSHLKPLCHILCVSQYAYHKRVTTVKA